MVWQPNILNNCYQFSGGYAPRTTHQGLCHWTSLGDFHFPDPLSPHLQILATPLLAVKVVVYDWTAHTLSNNLQVDCLSNKLLQLRNLRR